VVFRHLAHVKIDVDARQQKTLEWLLTRWITTTFNPNLVGGRSKFSFPFPSLCLPSLLLFFSPLSLPVPSPALEER